MGSKLNQMAIIVVARHVENNKTTCKMGPSLIPPKVCGSGEQSKAHICVFVCVCVCVCMQPHFVW